MGVPSYSTTAGSNTTIAGINIAEGWAPSSVNNAFRTALADTRKIYDDGAGKIVAGGSANAITLTTQSTWAALADGITVAFRAASNNSNATVTLALDSLTAKNVYRQDGTALQVGDIVSGGIYHVAYSSLANSSAGGWLLLNPSLSVTSVMVGDSGAGGVKGLVPAPAAGDAAANKYLKADGNWTAVSVATGVAVGTVADYAGTSAPSGWLFCYGQNVSRTTYSALFSALSTTYGVGDGSTTFGLPDLRGRVIAGKDDMGSSSANRLTNLSGGLDGDVLGASGGAETHTLTTAQLASHTHTWAIGTSTTGSSTSVPAGGVNPNATPNTGSAGSGSAHNNVQPTFILNKIIYTGV